MFQKLLVITVIATIATQAAIARSLAPPTANSTKVEEDISEKNSTQKITWDKLADRAVPAAAAINQALRAELVDQACGASDEPDRSYDYEATATVTEVNENYVSYTVYASSYCGGAHPNHGTYHDTFNSKTGEQLEFDKEVPRQNTDGANVDWDAFEKYQRELAETMFSEIKSSNSQVLVEAHAKGSRQQRL